MSVKGVCKDHHKEYETFCLECDEEKKSPMCSICMCNHMKEKHNAKGCTHIVSLIGDQMAVIKKQLPDPAKMLGEIKAYDTLAEERIKTKDQIKERIDEKLNQLKNFYKKSKLRSTEFNTTILQTHESLNKEIRNCELKFKESLKDTEKVQVKVEDLCKKQKYWTAYEEVMGIALEKATIDDNKEINKQIANIEKELNEYTQELKELEDLMPDSKKIKGIYIYFIYI